MKGLTNQRLLFLIAALALFSCVLALIQYVHIQEQTHRMARLEEDLDKSADTKALLTQQADKLATLETALADQATGVTQKVRVLDIRLEKIEAAAKAKRTNLPAPLMDGSATLNQHSEKLRLECIVASIAEQDMTIPSAIEPKRKTDVRKVRKQSGDNGELSTMSEPGGK